MERKTKVSYQPARHDVVITREFELPLSLLFKAYEDPEILEQWMGSKALKLENKKHGSYQLEKKDDQGNDNVAYTVTGIAEAAPANSHIQYDMLLSLSSDQTARTGGWGDIDGTCTYFF